MDGSSQRPLELILARNLLSSLSTPAFLASRTNEMCAARLKPRECAGTNMLGTINVLEAARAVGVRRVVYSTTGGGLHGDADVLPTPAEHPIRSLAPYGQAKLAAEEVGYCDLLTRLHGLSTVSLRYGNVYGPRQDVHGEAGVIAIFCECVVERGGADDLGGGHAARPQRDAAPLCLTGPGSSERG